MYFMFTLARLAAVFLMAIDIAYMVAVMVEVRLAANEPLSSTMLRCFLNPLTYFGPLPIIAIIHAAAIATSITAATYPYVVLGHTTLEFLAIALIQMNWARWKSIYRVVKLKQNPKQNHEQSVEEYEEEFEEDDYNLSSEVAQSESTDERMKYRCIVAEMMALGDVRPCLVWRNTESNEEEYAAESEGEEEVEEETEGGPEGETSGETGGDCDGQAERS
ncbi:hypothetical protein F5Y07DRAFT_54538 [Xylaria sp. FL0933]|nr:hypothetical protein F5Y07DRAFT_54538 [Xylaria sp. FL0933]